jgi:hypothetical protein
MLERNVISKIKVTHMFDPEDALLKNLLAIHDSLYNTPLYYNNSKLKQVSSIAAFFY